MTGGRSRYLLAGAFLGAFLAGLGVAATLVNRGPEVTVGPDARTESALPTARGSTEDGRVEAEATPTSDGEPESPPPTVAPTATVLPTSEPEAPTPMPTSAPPVVELVVDDQPPPTFDEALNMAESLAPRTQLPSSCGLPLDVPASLPNSSRAYRSGTHQGIDFICQVTGRSAVAALQGRVVMAVGDYVDPLPVDRTAVLGIAGTLGATPPWTLAMLYGNFVVLDHGSLDGVGHVVTIYAHLAEVDPALRIGAEVAAGQRLGEIGNLGTESAALGILNPSSLHLHWEIHIDALYLGAGLDAASTRAVYATLFGQS